MIVYVAAPSEELDRARRAMDGVRAAGHEVAHDWVAQIEALGTANRHVPPGAARALSLDAIRHVQRSAVLWLLWPKKPTIGAWIEVGSFITLLARFGGARLIISEGDVEASIFTNGMVHRAFERDADAARWMGGALAA